MTSLKPGYLPHRALSLLKSNTSPTRKMAAVGVNGHLGHGNIASVAAVLSRLYLDGTHGIQRELREPRGKKRKGMKRAFYVYWYEEPQQDMHLRDVARIAHEAGMKVEITTAPPRFLMVTDKGEPHHTIPMILFCPNGHRHIDEGDFAEHPHHTHSCQECGIVWRPAKVNTHGVKFLPGYKNGES